MSKMSIRVHESKACETAEVKDKQYYLDMFDAAYKECCQLAEEDGIGEENWAEYFATGDGNSNTFSQKEADEIVGYYMEFHPEGMDGDEQRPYTDWVENMTLANGDNPPTALDKEITRILKTLYAPNESKKSEGYNDYDAIRGWLEDVMDKAGTMFESAYVSDNGPGEICIEIEGYDSTGGDAIISLVFDECDTLEDTIAAIDEELSDYADGFDPDDEAKMYADSGMAGVPPLRELIKAMDERKEDMRTLSDAVHKAYREMV